ncbi:TolC family protein, partial [candidate division KSB1 bacterium]|nr:TolC family protein [candidate division KSB1 bacterium]
PLFDWGRRKSSIKAAEKFIESNRIEAQDEKNDIIISIRQACRELENQILETKATLKIEKKSEITFNRFFKRYKNENLSSMMLTLYLKQFLNQKINYIIALMEYRLAALDLKIQSLWDFEKNKSVLPLNEK